jgi:hypothetical protein
MHHLGIATRLSLVLVYSLAGCSGSSDAGKPEAGKTEAGKPEAGKTEAGKPEAATTVAAPADAEVEPAEQADPQPSDAVAPPSDPVVEPVASAEVEITAIAPTDHTAAWRSIQAPSEAIELVDLSAGVLGKGASGYFQIAEGQLAAVTFDPAPEGDGDVFGVWPDDAWVIERREKPDENDEIIVTIRLMKLRDGTRWVPQAYAGEQRFVLADQQFRKSTRAKGGLLVSEPGTTERLAGNGEPPAIGSHRGELVDYVETDSGKVYVISKEGAAFHVVSDCSDEACVTEKSRALPLTDWTFARQVTRDRHAASMLASASGREFVLHVRPQGWALGEFPVGSSKPEAMWASEDGGLWIKGADTLWHRDPSGTWRTVTLPEGLSGISVAVTTDQRELWIAGTLAGASVVFATQANAQSPAPG